MRSLPLFVVPGLLAGLLLASCVATGPKYHMLEAQLPPLKPGDGRVYFYRAQRFFGAAVTANIQVNGEVVGRSTPGGFFFVDLPPGDYEVSTTTEVERHLTFTLRAGEVRYVRTTVSMGVLWGRVYPDLVANDEGEKEIRDLAYTGEPLESPR